MHASQYRNPDLVEQLWRDIVRREPTVESLCAKIAELGRKFALAESVFPVAGLAYLLEKHALQLGDAHGLPGWPVLALADAGVSYAHLFDVYRRLSERVRCVVSKKRVQVQVHSRRGWAGTLGRGQAEWKVEGPFLHLAQSIRVLVERWLERIRGHHHHHRSGQRGGERARARTEGGREGGRWAGQEGERANGKRAERGRGERAIRAR